MTNARIINNIKYIQLSNDNHIKNKSLEDNVYFTLRDIFYNISGFDYCMEANFFNSKLTNDVFYEDRTSSFTYTNILNDKTYIRQLSEWLMYIHPDDFIFEQVNNDDNIQDNEISNTTKFMKFNDWWIQFEELRIFISNHLKY